MHGSEDRICDVEGSRRIAARMKAQGEPVTYVEWEGLYHEIHNGSETSTGEEVIEAMMEWMRSL